MPPLAAFGLQRRVATEMSPVGDRIETETVDNVITVFRHLTDILSFVWKLRR